MIHISLGNNNEVYGIYWAQSQQVYLISSAERPSSMTQYKEGRKRSSCLVSDEKVSDQHLLITLLFVSLEVENYSHFTDGTEIKGIF